MVVPGLASMQRAPELTRLFQQKAGEVSPRKFSFRSARTGSSGEVANLFSDTGQELLTQSRLS